MAVRPEIQVNVYTQTSGRELQPLQRVGYKLALFVFSYIVVASIVIFIVSFHSIQIPPLPMPPSSSANPEHYKQLVDAYKQSADVYQQMAKAQVDRAIQLFQLVAREAAEKVSSVRQSYLCG